MPLVIETASDLRAPCDVGSSGFVGTAKTGKRNGKKQLALCAAPFDDFNLQEMPLDGRNIQKPLHSCGFVPNGK